MVDQPVFWAHLIELIVDHGEEISMCGFEERAAIREYCGGQFRVDAEWGAYEDTCREIGVQPISRQGKLNI